MHFVDGPRPEAMHTSLSASGAVLSTLPPHLNTHKSRLPEYMKRDGCDLDVELMKVCD